MRYGLKKRVIGSEGTCKRGELTSRKRKGKDVIGCGDSEFASIREVAREESGGEKAR